jgi:hypothetical protein
MNNLTPYEQGAGDNLAVVDASTQAPYVVSADVAGVMGRWATDNGYTVPSQEFFNGMTERLADRLRVTTGVPVEIVSQREMYDGMDKLVSESPYPVISLDRAYFADGHAGISSFLDVTRAVREEYDARGDRKFVSAGDLVPRPGQPSLEEQIEALRSDVVSPIAIVDDVIFTGEGMVKLAEKLAEVGRPVALVIAGIGIEGGLEKLREAGIDVQCVRTYQDVMDEVCERDFLAGVPMSGRTVLGEDGLHWSAPYFGPYGNAEGWASIPSDAVREFSRFCLAQSLSLWEEVERQSGRVIPSNAVPRPLKDADTTPITSKLWHDYLNH